MFLSYHSLSDLFDYFVGQTVFKRLHLVLMQISKKRCCSHDVFSASPEPGPRPLKTEAEIEAGSKAFTNNNIVKNETEEKNQDGGDVKGVKEDISEDHIDDEHQTCLTEKS